MATDKPSPRRRDRRSDTHAQVHISSARSDLEQRGQASVFQPISVKKNARNSFFCGSWGQNKPAGPDCLCDQKSGLQPVTLSPAVNNA